MNSPPGWRDGSMGKEHATKPDDKNSTPSGKRELTPANYLLAFIQWKVIHDVAHKWYEHTHVHRFRQNK